MTVSKTISDMFRSIAPKLVELSNCAAGIFATEAPPIHVVMRKNNENLMVILLIY